jgi:hypothetical protein
MRVFLSLALVATALAVSAGEPPQPDIRDGIWDIPLRYWSKLSPVLEGTGGFDFLCEVQGLGEDVPAQVQGPFRFKTGTLKVLEVLHADTKKFPAVKTLKTLHVEGCESLKVGDRLIVFVDGEPYQGGYVIDRHRGTNCLIGHRLARTEDDEVVKKSEALLLELVRKDKLQVDSATTDELRILAAMDPAGVAEALTREIDLGRLIRKPHP